MAEVNEERNFKNYMIKWDSIGGDIDRQRKKLDVARQERDERKIDRLQRTIARLREERDEIFKLLLQVDGGKLVLFEFAKRGKIETVQSLLEEPHADINAKDAKGKTALHYAREHKGVVKFLLEHGAFVHATDNDGKTALHYAVSDVIKELIDHGVDVNAKDSGRNTAMHWACSGGHLERVKLLAQKGADINAKNNQGNTPLSQAVRHDRVAVVRYLLDFLNESGAEVVDELEVLLRYVCGTKLVKRKGDISKLLIEHGANVDGADEKGWTPLHRACESDNLEMVKFLVKNGANTNAIATTGTRRLEEHTPLDIAKAGGDIFKFLIEHGANVNGADERGRTRRRREWCR